MVELAKPSNLRTFFLNLLSVLISAVANCLMQLLPQSGLLDELPDHWATVRSKIVKLNQEVLKVTQYKVFFLGQHGQETHMFFCIMSMI